MSFQFIPGNSVEVPKLEFKNNVTIPGSKSALIVVDMQNDFVKAEGKLVVPAASKTVPSIRQLIQRGRTAGSKVIFTQDTQVEGDPEWNIWPEHCKLGSWGWQIIPELQPLEGDLLCQKNRYDGFYGTWLDHFLSHIWDIEHLVIVGTVSNICVLHTAASAGLRWFHIIIPANSISALTEFDQALTLRQVSFLYNGDIVTSEKAIDFQ